MRAGLLPLRRPSTGRRVALGADLPGDSVALRAASRLLGAMQRRPHDPSLHRAIAGRPGTNPAARGVRMKGTDKAAAPTLLHVVATPRPPGVSRTRKMAEAFLAAYAAAHPDHQVEELDLATTRLPDIDTPGVDALFGQRNGSDPGAIAARRRELDATVAPLIRCTALLVTSPMWNFTVPYRLKHWLDLVIQPGRTFQVENGGAVGLLGGRPAVVVCSRSFFYGPGTTGAAKNHFEPYLETALGFIGFDAVRFVALDGADLPGAEDRLAAAVASAREAGASV